MLAGAAPLHPLIFVAAWLLGNALQLRQQRLWPASTYALGAGAAIVACVCVAWLALRRARVDDHRAASLRTRGRVFNAPLVIVAAALLAFSSAGWRAHQRLQPELDASIEGVDVVVTGVVASLPRTSPDGVHFEFDVESPRDTVPQRLALGWYRDGWHGEGTSDDVPRIRAAERWQFTLRLRRPHGLMNPHGFDFELWLFERGIAATGSVRPGRDNRRLGIDPSRVVERARQSVRDAIERRVADPRASGLLAALAVGDQSAIDRAEWDLYRTTGVSHLMSISGLHVTMFAWLAAALVNAAWRRSLRACLWCPAPTAARVGGVLFATGYAVLAGWGVPAQRTVWMLATVVLLQVYGRRWPWPWVLGTAAFVVVAIDPWAWLQPGFWLSFVAVGLLMWSDASRLRSDDGAPVATPAGAIVTAWRGAARAIRHGFRTQLVATAGLAPLTLVFFQQVSIVGMAANLVAIPLVTLVVTPLALVGIAAPPSWLLGAGVIDGLHQVLAWLGQAPLATWTAPAAPWWAQLGGLVAGALAVAPLPWRARAFALPLALPLLLPVVERPEPGRFEAVAADVGQGTAVAVRTATKLMLFDTGPAYARERDAGERVLLPLLRARGEARIDHLVLSHQDIDHVGGAAALIDALPIGTLWSSLPDAHALRRRGLAHRACEAGASWQWDGVRFDVLHPPAGAPAAPASKPNSISCVVRVVDARGRALLIAGDIEAPQEAALLAARIDLRASALIVAHHGSRTSTTAEWLDAVQPRLAIVQAGYRNRFGHPAADVMRRLESRGVQVLRSDRCGAWTWRGDDGFVCERDERRRYWHDRSGDAVRGPRGRPRPGTGHRRRAGACVARAHRPHHFG